MAIPNKEQAQYNSLQEFIGFFKNEPNAPSYSNLFSVHFSTPPMLQNGAYGMNTTKYEPQREVLRTLLNYYAESVNLPSKQVTTGTYNQLGSAIRYATGSTFSQISITFRVPRSGETRAFFEKWISMMANDARQYTDYYNNYVCNTLRIYKWETRIAAGPKANRMLHDTVSRKGTALNHSQIYSKHQTSIQLSHPCTRLALAKFL